MNYIFRRTVYEDDKIIQQVVSLADANKATLGFIPANAMRESCKKGNVFVCLHNDKLMAYIFFTHLKRSQHIIKIHHFCVDRSARGKGIASLLFDNFKQTIRNAFCIELSCRDDYNLNNFWHKLGFNVVHAREGRAVNEKSTLHLYRLVLQKNLIDIIEETDTRPRIQLDASIVFSLNLDAKDFTEENSFLAYANDVIFCVAPIIYEDMQRQKDSSLKQQSIEKTSRFRTLSIAHSALMYESDRILKDFPSIKLGDRKQLACAIVNKVSCFITSDRQLLNLSAELADRYGLIVYSPSELYFNIGTILEVDDAQSSLLPSRHGKLCETTLNEEALCEDFLNHAAGEKKHSLLHKFLKNTVSASINDIVIGDERCGILFYSVNEDILAIHLLRFLGKVSRSVYIYSSFIFGEIIQIAARRGHKLVIFEDQYSSTDTQQAAKDNGFFDGQRIVAHFTGNYCDFNLFREQGFPHALSQPYTSYLETPIQSIDTFEQVLREKSLFPAKFLEIAIPAYIIPIRPSWAKDLLTPRIIPQYELIASEMRNVLLNYVNVYYSQTKTRLMAPARILWYVTQQKGIPFSGHIIAASYLDEIYTGTPKDLFKRFWKVGVFKWSDISSVSDSSCTAFIFSRTENFRCMVPYNTIKTAVKQHMGKGLTLISVTPISNDVYFDLYGQGNRHG